MIEEYRAGSTTPSHTSVPVLPNHGRVVPALVENSCSAPLKLSKSAIDSVSDGFNRAFVGQAGELGVFDYAVGHIDRELAYLRDFRQRLEEALESTVDTDEKNKRVLRRDQADDGGGTYG